MKYTIIDYKATDPVEIVNFKGFNSIEDIHTQEEGVARIAIQGLSDVLSLGQPVLEAVAKFKGVAVNAEAVWEAINPSPQRPTNGNPITPIPNKTKPKGEAKKKSASKPKKDATKDLPTDTDKTTSSSVAGDVAGENQESKENDMATTDKEKAAALKAKEKAKAVKAKEKEQAAKEKTKAKTAADKEKAAAKAAKAKAKETAAKEKAAAKAAKAKGPKIPRGEKTLAVKKLLERKNGCTRAQVLEATGWPAISMQAIAKNCGLKLRKQKEQGKVTVYFGS